EAAWPASFYELAAIPGTIRCGVLSDEVFSGRRAPVPVIYMSRTLSAVVVYWTAPAANQWIVNSSLWATGLVIYGTVRRIAVRAVCLVPKKAAGTAAGLTRLFGYFIGDLLANAALGALVDKSGWDACFEAILFACALAILFTAL